MFYNLRDILKILKVCTLRKDNLMMVKHVILIILVRNIIYYYISVTQFYGNVEKSIIIADIIFGTSFKNCMSLIIKYSKNR